MPLSYQAVIATFPGREAYLAECVESLRDQGVEPIVVCDTRWGPPKWNDALDACTTDLLFLPHDDDVYGPDYIREMVAYMEAHPEVAAVFCMDRSIDAEGRRLPKSTTLPFPERDTYDFPFVLNKMIEHGNFLRCETLCLRPSLIGDLRFPMDAGCGKAIDTAFWFLILQRHPIGIINKQLVSYREHPGQDTESERLKTVIDHWDAIDFAVRLNPDALEWDKRIVVEKLRIFHAQQKEMDRVREKAKTEKKIRLVVAHEPPDNAGTGVVAAHRVRQANEGRGEIAYYVFPDPNSQAVREGYFSGVPVVSSPPSMFAMVVKRFNPQLIEFHHTLHWGDDILGVASGARKELYLHDRWMWSEDPHGDGKFRDTRKYLEGIEVFGNSEWTCKEAKEKLGIDAPVFDPFVPLPQPKMSFRKRVGFFGGFATVKGVHILFQAARQLPDVLFILFSQLPEGMVDGRRVYGYPNIVVVGPYVRGDMPLLVSVVDAVVVPSLFESHGLVKREVESLGVPVISTRTGGMAGTVPPDDVQALVEAITNL